MRVFIPPVMQLATMVDERTTFVSLLFVIVVGMALILYGMWSSAGQDLNTPVIVGGIVLLAGLSMMVYLTVSVFEMQEQASYSQD